METKHTPNWSIDCGDLAMGNQIIASPGDFKPDGAPHSEGVANIRLAAAAPDLLDALRMCLLIVEHLAAESAPTSIAKARSAISRATGSAT